MIRKLKVSHVVILILGATLTGCTIGFDDDDMSSYIEQRNARWAKQYVENNVELVKVSVPAGYDVAVLKNDGEGDITIISVPGAPSEHGYWAEFAGGIDKSIEFAVLERPGYGQSGPGNTVLDFDEQADAIITLLNKDPGQCNIVMGSSFAGPLALLTAMKEPELVDGIIISAGLMKAPGNGARFLAFIGTALRPFASLPEDIDTVRKEIIGAPAQRRNVLARLDEINIPVVLIHGGMDKLVPTSNSYFLKEKLESITDVDLTIVPDAEHDLMIAHPEDLHKAVDVMVAKIEASGNC